MAYQSKYTGLQIDDILDSVEYKQDQIEDLESIRAGAAKGATALQSYTEKYTGTVTGIKINGTVKSGSGVIDLGTITTDISGKVDKVAGKQLSTEDFTTALKTKLEGLSNYDDTEIENAISSLQTQFNTLVSGDASDAINSFNEIMAFLDGIKDTQDLAGIIAAIEQQIAGKYTKPSGGIPASDLAPDVFLQGEKGEKGDKGDKGDTGAAGTNGTNGKDGTDGEDGATFTPSVDTDGNLSWTNDKGLSNPPTVNIKGPKGDSGEGGGGSSYAGNYPIVESVLVGGIDLEPNTYYVLESAGIGGEDALTFNINLVTPSNLGIVNEYVFELHGIEGAISLPAYITWVNGDVPTFSVGKSYIISIVNYIAVYVEF